MLYVGYLLGHPFPVSEANEIHCAEAMNLGLPEGRPFREGAGVRLPGEVRRTIHLHYFPIIDI